MDRIFCVRLLHIIICFNSNAQFLPLNQESQTKLPFIFHTKFHFIFSPKTTVAERSPLVSNLGHLTMSGDSFDYHIWEEGAIDT